MGAGGFLVLRDLSLFAVRDVRVTGATGPEAAPIASALRATATDMTTLHVDRAALMRSLSSFEQVRTVRVHRVGLHGLRIQVVQYVPVGAVDYAGRRVPVTGDGTLLRGMTAAPTLPSVEVRRTGGGDRIEDPAGLRSVALLDAAPHALRVRVKAVAPGPGGLTVTLRKGPAIYFGGPDRPRAKWAAAAAVLADPDARGARSVDVRAPERPAAAGLPEPPAAVSPAPPTPAAPAGPDQTTTQETPANPQPSSSGQA